MLELNVYDILMIISVNWFEDMKENICCSKKIWWPKFLKEFWKWVSNLNDVLDDVLCYWNGMTILEMRRFRFGLDFGKTVSFNDFGKNCGFMKS